MIFTVFTQNILKAIGTAERSCGKNLQLPIINHILLSVEKNKMKISATNLEQGVTIETLGKSDGSGKIAIPARVIVELLRSIKSEKITISAEKTALKIETDNHRAVIQGLDGDEFPSIPKSEEPLLFEISSLVFGKALERVVIAAARSGMRPELTGVFFEWNPKTDHSPLTIAATDSFRLAEYNFRPKELKVKDKTQNISCILPLSAVQEITRIAGEIEGDLAFAINETQIVASWSNGAFVSRLLEGSFPNYRTIIPQSFKTEINCKRKALIDLIRQAGLFASKINDVNLQVQTARQIIVLSGRDAAKGEYEGKLECKVSGEDIALTFNYQFLIDGLERIDGDDIMLGLNDSNAPALLQPAAGEIEYRYIAMPLRI